jgi:hypothetical protein
MRKYQNTLTLVRIVVTIAVLLIGVDYALKLMNESNTMSFIAGLIMLTVAIGMPIEYMYRKLKRK